MPKKTSMSPLGRSKMGRCDKRDTRVHQLSSLLSKQRYQYQCYQVSNGMSINALLSIDAHTYLLTLSKQRYQHQCYYFRICKPIYIYIYNTNVICLIERHTRSCKSVPRDMSVSRDMRGLKLLVHEALSYQGMRP